MTIQGFKLGTWWVICDRCGWKYKNTQLHKEQHTGLMVCLPCLDKRNPQDFAKILRSEKPIPWSRPDAEDAIAAPDCDTLTDLPYPNVFSSDYTIYKGYSTGPVTILDGYAVTVKCTWTIR